MSAEDLVRRFYDDMWNRWDEDLARDILSPDLDFRGSIGLHVTGHDGFIGYMRLIRTAFPDFHNEIVDLVADGDRVAARLSYTGTHEGPFLDHTATGRRIEYAGAAFFSVVEGRIAGVWVLGDTLALMRGIGATDNFVDGSGPST